MATVLPIHLQAVVMGYSRARATVNRRPRPVCATENRVRIVNRAAGGVTMTAHLMAGVFVAHNS